MNADYYWSIIPAAIFAAAVIGSALGLYIDMRSGRKKK